MGIAREKGKGQEGVFHRIQLHGRWQIRSVTFNKRCWHKTTI